tara:strand:- start:148 stop:330 length:183 start_codon:yes stop_codon:yes gene_type:complete
MITIEINKNFKEWFNICLFGKVVDNAKTRANALSLAYKIQEQEKAQGNQIYIKKSKSIFR